MNKLFSLALLGLAACGPTKNNFAENLTEISCARLEECAKGSFDALYTSVDDCVARSGDVAIEGAECMGGHCAFDKNNATQCLDDVKDSDCDEIVDGSAYADCAEVWTDCDGDEGECMDVGTTPTDTNTTAGT